MCYAKALGYRQVNSQRTIGAPAEAALTRVLLASERSISADEEALLSRHGHIFDGEAFHIPALNGPLKTMLYRAFVREHLLSAIPADCDQIIEIGGGTGHNLFHLWLGGSPHDAEYLSLEPNRRSRDISAERARLAPTMRFRAEDFDARTMAGFARHVTGAKAFVFTCGTLTVISRLADDFFDSLLAPNVCAGLHCEPGAWQIGGKSSISLEAGAYDEAHGRNVNWIGLLAAAHRARKLRVARFCRDAFCWHALNPMSVAKWTRHCTDPPYPLGQLIDFSQNGNGDRLLVHGWSAKEEWGYWTDGPRAAMYLSLADVPDTPINLKIEAISLPTLAGDRQAVQVVANGTHLATWRLATAPQTYEAALAPELWRPFNAVELTFNIHECVAPAALGVSRDERRLGLGLRTLTLRVA
jgi:hypothetical protein